MFLKTSLIALGGASAMIAGEWPIYQPMDGDGTRVARYGTH